MTAWQAIGSGDFSLCCVFNYSSPPWNNGKEVPRWRVAEIQKMSPSTTGRCCHTSEWGQPTNGSKARRQGSQSQLYSFIGIIDQTLNHFFGRPVRKLFLTSVPILPWGWGISLWRQARAGARAPPRQRVCHRWWGTACSECGDGQIRGIQWGDTTTSLLYHCHTICISIR